MRIFILLTMTLFSLNGFSQLTSNNVKTELIPKSEKYVIGIGNHEIDTYKNVLNYLKNDNAVDIYAICESQNIIGFKTSTSTYKSYDIIRDLLLNEFEGLKLYRKDESIFSKDCSDELLKQ
jgi:hypothetical protein